MLKNTPWNTSSLKHENTIWIKSSCLIGQHGNSIANIKMDNSMADIKMDNSIADIKMDIADIKINNGYKTCWNDSECITWLR